MLARLVELSVSGEAGIISIKKIFPKQKIGNSKKLTKKSNSEWNRLSNLRVLQLACILLRDTKYCDRCLHDFGFHTDGDLGGTEKAQLPSRIPGLSEKYKFVAAIFNLINLFFMTLTFSSQSPRICTLKMTLKNKFPRHPQKKVFF